jgi:hypothetical protein
MNEIYSRLPPPLMGMVELMYDVNNHPRIYLIEELLYTEYESVLRQHMTLSLSTTPESQRRFFMSTPRIQSADTVTLQRDFSDPRLDHLTSMRLEPMPLNELEEKLQIPGLAGRLQPFVTTEVPTRREPDYNGDGVRVRYFGHACVMLQTAEVTILVDPMFAAEPLPGDAPSSCSRLTIHDVPDKIDYLVFSHCHQDHFSVEVLLQLRTRIRKVVVPLNNRGSITDPSMKLILAQMGILDVLSLGYFDSVEFEGGRLTAVPFPGEHSDLEVYSKQSLLFEINGRKLLFLVDSDCWDMALYQRIARRVLNGNDPVEALFLGMECQGAPLSWQYGPLLTRPLTRRDDESRRLSGSNFARASNIVQQFNCRRVYVYAMGQEPWMRYLMGLEYAPDNIQISESNKLIEHCRAQGKISERLYGSQDLLL